MKFLTATSEPKKHALAEGAKRADWDAMTEQTGGANEAEPWIADVMANKEHHKVALEV